MLQDSQHLAWVPTDTQPSRIRQYTLNTQNSRKTDSIREHKKTLEARMTQLVQPQAGILMATH